MKVICPSTLGSPLRSRAIIRISRFPLCHNPRPPVSVDLLCPLCPRPFHSFLCRRPHIKINLSFDSASLVARFTQSTQGSSSPSTLSSVWIRRRLCPRIIRSIRHWHLCNLCSIDAVIVHTAAPYITMGLTTVSNNLRRSRKEYPL